MIDISGRKSYASGGFELGSGNLGRKYIKRIILLQWYDFEGTGLIRAFVLDSIDSSVGSHSKLLEELIELHGVILTKQLVRVEA